MKILVINAGSSSLKLQVFDTGKNHEPIYKSMADRIGKNNSLYIEYFENRKKTAKVKLKNHEKALKYALDKVLENRIIDKLSDIDAVGHRVVHGGEKYTSSTKITPSVIKEVRKLCSLAPLHNPPNLAGIMACKKILKKIPQVAVFDTAFHQTMENKAYLYALPYSYYKKFDIRRFGFHGTSHSYISKETIKLLGKKQSKIVSCHLGNGSSITAIKNGVSIDTSMGFTPLEGVPMGTRCGDIDPAIVIKLMEKLKKSPSQIYKILNNKSGLKGLSMLSADMRDLHANSKTNKQVALTISVLAYRIAKYIGAYSASLKGLDAITFTAGLGENAYYLRKEICDYLPHLGVKLDSKKNRVSATTISAKGSKVKIYVIPTNEEKEIAFETQMTLK